MTEQELLLEMQRMSNAGLHPLLCDTRVPLVDVPVLAGVPAEPGDATAGNAYVMLPRELVGSHPVFLIEAQGKSMLNIGINPGDILEVTMDAQAYDGDVVVAEVEGAYTVKTFYTDGEGIAWLVPANDEFEAIRLTGRQWRIIGKVTGIRRGAPRPHLSSLEASVQRSRCKDLPQQRPSAAPRVAADQPRNIIFKQFVGRRHVDFAAIRSHIERVVVMQMRHRYEWFAAYRILADIGLLEETQLTRFEQQMRLWFPDVPIPCRADSLGDYASGHTSRAFKLWSSDAFRRDIRKGQSQNGFNTLYHRCEELLAVLYPLPTLDMGLPF